MHRLIIVVLVALLVAGRSVSAFADYPAVTPVNTLDGSNGFGLLAPGLLSRTGGAVNHTGDINGDGIGDAIIGVRYQGTNNDLTYVVFGSDQGFTAVFELDFVDGSNGFALVGNTVEDSFGFEVSGAGDINNDGIDDLIVGAPFADVQALTDAGQAYVIYGSDQGFPASIDVTELDGQNGFRLLGVDDDGNIGLRVSEAGDINDDGIADFVIGAMHGSPGGIQEAGSAYVVFGTAVPFPAVFDLALLDGSNGFAIHGFEILSFSGRAKDAGDINGDGIDDLVIGAGASSPNGKMNAGTGYVLFGSNQPWPAIFELSSIDGTNGFGFNGATAVDVAATGINGGGDLNADGFADVLVGVPGDDTNGEEAGAVYVIFGSDQPFPASMELIDVPGVNGFAIYGIAPGDGLGLTVAGGSDLDGDGIDDLVVGAPLADPGGASAAGEVYLISGSDQGFPAVFDLTTLDGANGTRIPGHEPGAFTGGSAGTTGDLNGDGVNDLIIGAWFSGEAYVVFGGPPQGIPNGIHGTVTNALALNIACTNRSSGQSVAGRTIPGPNWNCTTQKLDSDSR